ncbi:hypothetical protein B7P43_G02965, partial [Cryptotermes secundus]
MPGLIAGYHELKAYISLTGSDTTKASTMPSAGAKLEESYTNKLMEENIELCENNKDSPGVMIPAKLAFKLYDTYGLEETVIQELARVEGFQIDVNGFRHLLNVARAQTKESFRSDAENEQVQEIFNQLVKLGLDFTENTEKYSYVKENDKYVFPSMECEVKAIIVNGKVVPKIGQDTHCSVILDRSNFYHKAGGQASDTGQLVTNDGTQFHVTDVTNSGGYLLHHGYVTKGNGVCIGDTATVEVNGDHRLGKMRNHTATHLLNAALHKTLTVTCQKSSRVTESNLVFEFSIYGETLNIQNIVQLEEMVQKCVQAAIPVKQYTVSSNQFFSLENVTLVPGEVYPEEEIRVIEVEADGLLTSREACCGTHVLNTGDIRDFCVVGLKTAGSGVLSLKAVTGDYATSARQHGHHMAQEVVALHAEVEGFIGSKMSAHQAEQLNVKLQELKQKLVSGTQNLPYTVRSEELLKIENISKRLKENARGSLRDALETEMQTLLATNQSSFLVHFLQCSSTTDTVPLQKATRMCPHIPVLLLAHSEGLIKARCCVPEALVSRNFSAQLWMQSVLQVLRAQGAAPRGQNPCLVFYMKGKKLPP